MSKDFTVTARIQFLRMEKVANPEEGYSIQDHDVIEAIVNGDLTYNPKVWQCRVGDIKIMKVKELQKKE